MSLITACQGDFSRPALDHPNDAANGQLPPTPTMTAVQSVEHQCDSEPPAMQLSWTIDSEHGIAEYQLFRSSSAALDPGDLILHVPAGILEVSDDTVEEGRRYFYRVRAVDTDGRLGWRSAAMDDSVTCSPGGMPSPRP